MLKANNETTIPGSSKTRPFSCKSSSTYVLRGDEVSVADPSDRGIIGVSSDDDSGVENVGDSSDDSGAKVVAKSPSKSSPRTTTDANRRVTVSKFCNIL